MPFPVFRNPNILQPRVEQFPLPGSMGEREMLAQRLLSQEQGFRFPRGLLDVTPAQRFGERPGLLQPVVFDRLRVQRGLLGGTGTEGAPGMRGGGGGRSWVEMDRTRAPTQQERMPAIKFRWTRNEDVGDYTTVTPSGVKVYMEPRGGSTEVSFFSDFRAAERAGNWSSKGTKRSLDRFSDVFNAITDFLGKHPGTRTLRFSAAGPSHEKLYKVLAPKLAKELGGTHAFENGFWKIFLP